jgi:hypothetical protein
MRSLLSAVLATLLTLGGSVTIMSSTAQAETGSSTASTTEELAVDDLRACLSESPEPKLAVYYLVDASRSMEQTDAGFLRAEVVASSLGRLAAIQTGVKPVEIRYAVGFFGNSFYEGTEWSEFTEGAVADVETQIKEEPLTGGTNWSAGLLAARSALQSQDDACKAMVWITDGQVRVYDAQGQFSEEATSQSLVDLCGTLDVISQIEQESVELSPKYPNGIFYEIRRSRVSVFGVFLDEAMGKPENARGIVLMEALVEAESPGLPGVKCGSQSLAGGEARGTVIHAKGPNDLAISFERLAGWLLGGRPDTVGIDGKFDIGRGVARFRLTADDTVSSIVDPSGKQLIDDATRVTFPSGNDLEVNVESSKDFGTWTAGNMDARPRILIRFGDIEIGRLDLANVRSGQDGVVSNISFNMGTAHPTFTSLADYTFDVLVTATYPDGTTDELWSTTHTSVIDGVNTIPGFILRPEFLDVEFNVVVSNVFSVDGDPLANVVARQTADLPPPGKYPTAEASESAGQAVDIGIRGTETITISGPTESDSGTVCFAEPLVAQVMSEVYITPEQFNWFLEDEEGNAIDGLCVEVARGEIRNVTLGSEYRDSASDAASSNLKAVVPVKLASSSDVQTISPEITVDFETSANKDLTVLLIVQALIFAIGFLLPLALLSYFRSRTARVLVGSMLNAVVAEVKYDSAKKRLLYSDLKASGTATVLTSVMKSSLDLLNVDPSERPVRNYSPAGGGLLSGRFAATNPFKDSWVEYAAPEGFVVLTNAFENDTRNLRDPDFASGSKVKVGSGLRDFKVLLVAASDILATDLDESFVIPSRIILYSSPSVGNPDSFDEDLEKLLAPDYSRELQRVKVALQEFAEKAQINAAKTKDKTTTAARPFGAGGEAEYDPYGSPTGSAQAGTTGSIYDAPEGGPANPEENRPTRYE